MLLAPVWSSSLWITHLPLVVDHCLPIISQTKTPGRGRTQGSVLIGAAEHKQGRHSKSSDSRFQQWRGPGLAVVDSEKKARESAYPFVLVVALPISSHCGCYHSGRIWMSLPIQSNQRRCLRHHGDKVLTMKYRRRYGKERRWIEGTAAHNKPDVEAQLSRQCSSHMANGVLHSPISSPQPPSGQASHPGTPVSSSGSSGLLRLFFLATEFRDGFFRFSLAVLRL
jgi:hypothetical protein